MTSPSFVMLLHTRITQSKVVKSIICNATGSCVSYGLCVVGLRSSPRMTGSFPLPSLIRPIHYYIHNNIPIHTLQCGTLLILIILNMWTILWLQLSSHHLQVSSPLLQAVSAPCEIHKNANIEVRPMFHIYFVST